MSEYLQETISEVEGTIRLLRKFQNGPENTPLGPKITKKKSKNLDKKRQKFHQNHFRT